MDADILQSGPFADAPQRFTETRQVRAGLEAANDVRIPGHTRNEFETTDRRIAQGCKQWFAVFRESDEQSSHVPIDIDPLRFQEFRAAQPSQQQHPQAMAGVLVVFLFEAADEAWHFDGCNESFALSLAKSHDAADRAVEVFRHVARHFPPVEHLADDFENVVRSVGVLRADF